MSLVEIDWKPDRKKLVEFSRVLAIALVVLAAFIAYKTHAWQAADRAGALRPSLILAGVAVLLATLGVVAPRALRPVYLVWMGLSFPLGLVMTNLIVAIMFYVIFTPVGLVMRMGGRDPLQLKRVSTGTCWIEREPAPPSKRYFHQY